MPLEVINRYVLLRDLNSLNPFVFSDSINCYAYGLTGYSLSFPDLDDHHIANIQVSMTISRTGANVLNVNVKVDMYDKYSKQPDQDSSWITVAVLAWTGTNSANSSLSNTGLVNSDSTINMSLAGTNPTILQPIFAGFNLSYDSKDHHILSIQGSASVNYTGTAAQVTPTSSMRDDSGHSNAPSQADGGIVAGFNNPGFMVQAMNRMQYPAQWVNSADFGTKLSACIAVMASFKCQYPDGHDEHINTIRVGLTGNGNPLQYLPYIDGGSPTCVRLPAPAATMWDTDSKPHYQDNNLSNVDLLVVGIPVGVPTTVTKPATNISATAATLNAVINANGQNTDVSFNYGTTSQYGNTINASSIAPQYPFYGTQLVNASIILPGLQPSTTYHVRVLATNASGTTYGSDLTFMTPSG